MIIIIIIIIIIPVMKWLNDDNDGNVERKKSMHETIYKTHGGPQAHPMHTYMYTTNAFPFLTRQNSAVTEKQ